MYFGEVILSVGNLLKKKGLVKFRNLSELLERNLRDFSNLKMAAVARPKLPPDDRCVVLTATSGLVAPSLRE
jgi:hypothetical protein